MDFTNSGHVAIALFILNVVFNLGFYWARLKQFPTKAEVLELMKVQDDDLVDKINEQIKGHCPYTDLMNDNKVRLNGFDDWISKHEKFAAAANEENHLLLQELVINTQNICDKLKIKYLKKNGK